VGFEELLPYVISVTAITIAALIILYVTRLRKEEKVPLETSIQPEALERWRHRVQKSVSSDDATEASYELRTLGLEREILSDAIRRLYEAHAEGKITEEEREQLGKRYKSRMMSVKDAIAENESVVALHELEAMQEDLIKLFDERFDDLNVKIENLRSRIGLETKETIIPTQIPTPVPTQMEAEEPREKETSRKTRRKTTKKQPKKTGKTIGEERIEKIKAEVEKVLDRLEQMEAET
jgi:hypothetical protein